MLGRGEHHRERGLPFYPVTGVDVGGGRGSRVVVEGRHHELLQESERGDFLQQ